MIPTICKVLLLIEKDNIIQEIKCQPQWKAPLFPAMPCGCYAIKYGDKGYLLCPEKGNAKNG
jgi:hypothetical protein